MKFAGDLALTFAIAFAGGALAYLIGLPVPWLIGSALAVALANLAGAPIRMPSRMRDATFLVLGALAGSGVTPAVLEQVALWPISFVIQMIGVVGVVVGTMLFLQRGLGWDRETAFFAALPGALSLVVATAAQTNANMSRVLVVQSVRLLVLLIVLTPLLGWLEGGAEPAVVTRGTQAGSLAAWQIALFCGAVLASALVAERFHFPAGIMIGSLVASAVLHGTGVAPVSIPQPLVLVGLVSIGVIIGERVRREHRRELAQLMPVALGALAIGFSISAASGLVAHWVLGIDLGRIAVAYAPGALEALTAVAYQFDIDPAYVAAHHVVRFLGLALLIPILARWLAGAATSVPAPEDPAAKRDL